MPGALKETEEDELRTNKNTEGRPNMSTDAIPVVEKSKDNESMLNNLKEGLLGKLEILKSGAARLSLGENKLIVELGPQIFSRQVDLLKTLILFEELKFHVIKIFRTL